MENELTLEDWSLLANLVVGKARHHIKNLRTQERKGEKFIPESGHFNMNEIAIDRAFKLHAKIQKIRLKTKINVGKSAEDLQTLQQILDK